MHTNVTDSRSLVTEWNTYRSLLYQAHSDIIGLFEWGLKQEDSFTDPTLWFHSLGHAWTNKEVSVNSLFAGWSQKTFSEVIFKKPRKIELLFLVCMSQLSLSVWRASFHIFCLWNVSSRLYPRHWGIDKMLI